VIPRKLGLFNTPSLTTGGARCVLVIASVDALRADSMQVLTA
jgi:hypothetical protein